MQLSSSETPVSSHNSQKVMPSAFKVNLHLLENISRYVFYTVHLVCVFTGGGGVMFGMCGRGPMGNLACLQGWQFPWEVGQNW